MLFQVHFKEAANTRERPKERGIKQCSKRYGTGAKRGKDVERPELELRCRGNVESFVTFIATVSYPPESYCTIFRNRVVVFFFSPPSEQGVAVKDETNTRLTVKHIKILNSISS